jgi:hypothetical protein
MNVIEDSSAFSEETGSEDDASLKCMLAIQTECAANKFGRALKFTGIVGDWQEVD